jgi:hypothetical protein
MRRSGPLATVTSVPSSSHIRYSTGAALENPVVDPEEDRREPSRRVVSEANPVGGIYASLRRARDKFFLLSCLDSQNVSQIELEVAHLPVKREVRLRKAEWNTLGATAGKTENPI